MSDPTPLVQAVLTEHRHKPPRVQAKLVTDAIAHLLAPPVEEVPPVVPLPDDTPEWSAFRKRLTADPFAALTDAGFATTRNRTGAAMRALGLDPHEVRAVVIEHDWLRVYRHRGAAQTMPILEERTA